jgi:hypothetical protein
VAAAAAITTVAVRIHVTSSQDILAIQPLRALIARSAKAPTPGSAARAGPTQGHVVGFGNHGMTLPRDNQGERPYCLTEEC